MLTVPFPLAFAVLLPVALVVAVALARVRRADRWAAYPSFPRYVRMPRCRSVRSVSAAAAERDSLILALAARVADQAALLSRRAERGSSPGGDSMDAFPPLTLDDADAATPLPGFVIEPLTRAELLDAFCRASDAVRDHDAETARVVAARWDQRTKLARNRDLAAAALRSAPPAPAPANAVPVADAFPAPDFAAL